MSSVPSDRLNRDVIQFSTWAALPTVLFTTSPVLLKVFKHDLEYSIQESTHLLAAEMTGYVVGHFVVSLTSRLSQRQLTLALALLSASCNVVCAFAPPYLWFLLLRLCSGLYFGHLRNSMFTALSRSGTHDKGYGILVFATDVVTFLGLASVSVATTVFPTGGIFYFYVALAVGSAIIPHASTVPRRSREEGSTGANLSLFLRCLSAVLLFNAAQGVCWIFLGESRSAAQNTVNSFSMELGLISVAAGIGLLALIRRGEVSIASLGLLFCVNAVAVATAHLANSRLLFLGAVWLMLVVWNVSSARILGVISRLSPGAFTISCTSIAVRLGTILGPVLMTWMSRDSISVLGLVSFVLTAHLMTLAVLASLNATFKRK